MKLTSLIRSLLTAAAFVGLSLPAVAAQPREALVYFGTYTRGASKGIYVSRLDLKSGHLTEPELAAEAGNPAFLAIHPNKRFLYAVGEVNKGGGVMAYEIKDDGKLTFLNERPSGGAGPTHLVVDRTGKNVLVANYGGGSIACLPLGADGRLAPLSDFVQHQGGSNVNPKRQAAPHAHGIYTDPANRFVFVPDLGMDKVMIYRFDPAAGKLTPNDPAFAAVAPGAGPRHFGFEPKGRYAYVINEMVCTMTAFSYAASAGRLTEIQTLSTLPEGVKVEQGYSTAEVFAHPSGKFLYGSNRGHDTIAVFAINPKDGTLKLVENEPTQTKIPRGFGIDPTGRYLIAGGQNSDNAAVFRIDQKTGALEPTGQSVKVGSPVCVEFVAR
jgi:6-phosphogluconolactonase